MNFTDKCSILAGATGQGGEALITVMNDGLADERRQHAIPLLFRNGVWTLAGEERVLPWLAAGIASTHSNPGEFVIVGWAGQVLAVEGQESRRGAIQRKEDYVSIVRSVTTINDVVYAVGMRRQVHRRVDGDRWEANDRGVAYRGDEPGIGFNAIDGFDDDEIYAVGLDGAMWYQIKGEWHQINSPTNVHLHSVCCASNGQVYVGGRSGLFIRGRRDSWKVIELETDKTLWGMHWFADELYILFDQGIYHGTNEQIEKIENDVVGDGDFISLSSDGGKLWAFGGKKIAQFDGSSWSNTDCLLSDERIDSDVAGFFNDDVLSAGSVFLEDDE